MSKGEHQLITEHWFGSETDPQRIADSRGGLWWGKDTRVDAELAQRFAEQHHRAALGELEDWLDHADARLAIILLLDQIPRNIYRETRRAFATDSQAIAVLKQGLNLGQDLQLPPIRRVFFYMPLQHAENIDDQDLSIKQFTELAESVGPEQRQLFESYLDFALRHRQIIDRFGRFPHRNVILGRTSTAEELEFLRQPGSSF